ncbi:serine/threonine-protein kinase [Myxococcus xanthus]|uniref:serine/threonine-protein kinase n=1 Tax=Myxococcus xanthus TaxID=34 RepID=UPI001375FB99|nr:serine/threonine-protein kinase [Myxococcus xanthus]
MRTAVDVASSDLVLRCYAPQMLVEAYRRAQSAIGDARERLGWRLGFADLVQRYIVAVLAAENAGLDLRPPEAYLKLINKLDTPSLGDWALAAEALAGSILASGKAQVAPEFTSLLVTLGPGGKLERSSITEHLKQLIDLRNTLFHRDGAPLPDEATAQECLAQIDGPLRTVCEALRFLHDYPLLYVATREELQNGSEVVRVLRFSGTEPEWASQLIDGSELKVPTKVPFIASRSGDVLLLAPFVVIARNEASGMLEARMLYGWNGIEKHFEYSALHGGTRGAARTERSSFITTREELRQIKPLSVRRSGAVSQPVASRLAELIFPGEPVVIPGLKIQGKLGAGASSIVYLAREEFKGRPPGPNIAVKVLRHIVAVNQLQRQRLRMEHELLANLNHPSIVKVSDYRDEPSPHLLMEYVNGEDLQSAVDRKSLPASRAVTICLDVLSALESAHAHGVIHRDVKPSNIIVDRTGSVRLIDFGIATAEHLARQTRTLDAVGTVAFAAPEQLQRTGEVDERADLYALGRVLEFLVAGELGPMRVISDKLPPGLHAIVRKATQTAPEHRFQSAAAMRDALLERQQANWGGAPVQMGDRINESYELHDLKGEHEGIWTFDGAEIASDERVAIALTTVASAGAARLSDAIRACPTTVRSALGFPRLQRTADRLLFCAMAPGEPSEMLLALLAARAPVTAAQVSDTGDQQNAPAHLHGLHSYIQFIEHSDPQSNDANVGLILRAAEYARRAILAIMIGFSRERNEEFLPRAWGDVTTRSLGGLIFTVTPKWQSMLGTSDEPFRTDLSALLELAPALQELANTRNQVAHFGLSESAGIMARQFAPSLHSLLEIGSRVLRRNTESELAPFMTRMSDGSWTLLEVLGTKVQYVSLVTLDKTYEVPADLAASFMSLRAGEVESPLGDRSFAWMHEGEKKLVEIIEAWPHVGKVDVEATTTLHGRRHRTRLLALARGSNRPIFVIRYAQPLNHPKNMNIRLNELGSSAMAFRVPFAVITDGKNWQWYRFDTEEGLLPLRDDQEVKAYARALE